MTGSAPVGSMASGAEVAGAGPDSSAGVLGGVGAEGVVTPVVQPAQTMVAAKINGSVSRFMSEFPPLAVPYREHRSGE